MAPHAPSSAVDTYDRVFYILLAFTIGGFLMAAIGILGEVLGWWNDTGTIVITGGTVIGGLAAMVTLRGHSSSPAASAASATSPFASTASRAMATTSSSSSRRWT